MREIRIDGARFASVDQAMAAADLVVSNVFLTNDYACRLTSGVEGEHQRNSLHYGGAARDYGFRDVPAYDRLVIRDAASTFLGPDFDVVMSDSANCLHVEWQPGRRS
jgi:hypothetical protein